jgi:hypothetical protein
MFVAQHCAAEDQHTQRKTCNSPQKLERHAQRVTGKGNTEYSIFCATATGGVRAVQAFAAAVREQQPLYC